MERHPRGISRECRFGVRDMFVNVFDVSILATAARPGQLFFITGRASASVFITCIYARCFYFIIHTLRPLSHAAFSFLWLVLHGGSLPYIQKAL